MQTVTKRDLVDSISIKRPDINKAEITEVVQLFLESMVAALVEGQRIELRDFGVFTPKDRAARKARNPKTGATVDVPATKVATFKIGKEMKLRLAGVAVLK